jgi:DNA-binding LacI/PurR family transcriptional regulator
MGADADPGLIVEGAYSRAGGEAGMVELLARHPDLDAVFVGSDLMAGAVTALHETGLRVPDDVAVGGVDDSSIATSTRPRLTPRPPMP